MRQLKRRARDRSRISIARTFVVMISNLVTYAGEGVDTPDRGILAAVESSNNSFRKLEGALKGQQILSIVPRIARSSIQIQP
jgi:hypothetical protein